MEELNKMEELLFDTNFFFGENGCVLKELGIVFQMLNSFVGENQEYPGFAPKSFLGIKRF